MLPSRPTSSTLKVLSLLSSRRYQIRLLSVMDSEDSFQDGPVAKRPRLGLIGDLKTAFKPKHTVPTYTRSSLRSLDRAISPPAGKPANSTSSAPLTSSTITEYKNEDKKRGYKTLPSPIQLTRIRDLPADHNVDTVGLKDILGDPMIKECWQFNYLFNLDFLMSVIIKHLVNFNKSQSLNS